MLSFFFVVFQVINRGKKFSPVSASQFTPGGPSSPKKMPENESNRSDYESSHKVNMLDFFTHRVISNFQNNF